MSRRLGFGNDQKAILDDRIRRTVVLDAGERLGGVPIAGSVIPGLVQLSHGAGASASAVHTQMAAPDPRT